MRLWRLVVDLNPGVWTVIAAAEDHIQAWNVTQARLPEHLRGRATLEELEGTYQRCATGLPRLVHVWPTAQPRRWSPPSAPAAPRAA
jgi:hypothetical protein